jgi:two-component system CheB/CheR fusion protein
MEPTNESSEQATSNVWHTQPSRGVVLIALGASAGGLHAMTEFFAAVPRHSGLSYVIVSHVKPDRRSLLDVILRQITTLPVSVITEGDRPQRDHIYVPPPWSKVRLHSGVLRLAPAGELLERAGRIDYFFESVARELGQACAGVVLSGGGADGSSGLVEIASYGGLTVVQDPATAEHDGMPRHAIAAGAAQYVLAPAAMPAVIAEHFASEADCDQSAPPNAIAPSTGNRRSCRAF